jgi:hypothetical protein
VSIVFSLDFRYFRIVLVVSNVTFMSVFLKSCDCSGIAKDRCKCEESTNLGALRSNIRCETTSRRFLESVRRKRPELWQP